MLLYTQSGFQNIDFDHQQATITEEVQQADFLTLQVNNQETCYKVSMYGVRIEAYPDNTSGMTDLKEELELQNTGLKITTKPIYNIHPTKRVKKLHSSVIITLTYHECYNKLTKHGMLVF